MPISYLRALAHKSFNIHDYLLELSYKGKKILKEYNEIYIKEYLKKKLIKIIINIIT